MNLSRVCHYIGLEFPLKLPSLDKECLSSIPGCLKDRKEVFWMINYPSEVLVKKDLNFIKCFFAEENYSVIVDPLDNCTLIGVRFKPVRINEISGLETGLVSSMWVKDKDRNSTYTSIIDIDGDTDDNNIQTADQFYDLLIKKYGSNTIDNTDEVNIHIKEKNKLKKMRNRKEKRSKSSVKNKNCHKERTKSDTNILSKSYNDTIHRIKYNNRSSEQQYNDRIILYDEIMRFYKSNK